MFGYLDDLLKKSKCVIVAPARAIASTLMARDKGMNIYDFRCCHPIWSNVFKSGKMYNLKFTTEIS